ncbi:MAG: hypothetical protein KAQ62_00855 [Cyclobacteriaceae bacterium]|nr:hypothetical protein [Cyclobacteriaceae bacterium]MCK5209718.1 hypothetical protein [Cyclobacteriaceae bacterium]MCK5279787.1 hypothetical protein [Cyclobacteriaceae bacterium]MCK5367058.1 hypothetical protein [Cyclobacteriaceae bacterium]MCK5468469.1 hypothetical protein [Cyclobacteriaceae bacterium]
MKRVSIILMLIFISLGAFAQNREAMKKIESARIALITERLGLSPEQAEKFWPVYREYNMERREIRQEFREARKDVDIKNLTEEQSKQLIQKSMDLKQKELNLEREYAHRMSDVISTQQLFKLKNAEKDFQQMLLKRIQDQRQRQDQNQKMMQRREMMKDRNNN